MEYQKAYRYFDGLNLEYNESNSKKPIFGQDRCSSSVDVTKEDLLFQLLTAKKVLETKTRDPKEGIKMALQVYQNVEDQKRVLELSVLKKQIILRQRKNSTAIKVANLQKETTHVPSERHEIMEMMNVLAALSLQIQQIEQETNDKKRELDFRQKCQMSVIEDLGGVDMRYSSEDLLGVHYDSDTYDNSVNYTCSMPALNQIPVVHSSKITDKRDKIFALFNGRALSKTKRKFWSFHGLTKPEMELTKYETRPISRSLKDRETKDFPDQNIFRKVSPENIKKTKISKEALYEIEEFMKLIENYKEKNGISCL